MQPVAMEARKEAREEQLKYLRNLMFIKNFIEMNALVKNFLYQNSAWSDKGK